MNIDYIKSKRDDIIGLTLKVMFSEIGQDGNDLKINQKINNIQKVQCFDDFIEVEYIEGDFCSTACQNIAIKLDEIAIIQLNETSIEEPKKMNFKTKKELESALRNLEQGESILIYEDYERLAKISVPNDQGGLYQFNYIRRCENLNRLSGLESIMKDFEYLNALDWANLK